MKHEKKLFNLQSSMYNLAQLDKSSKKYICPQCQKKSFVYYLSLDGTPVDERVGRCDREDNCAYHYTPKQYYTDNNISRDNNYPRQRLIKNKSQKISPKIDYIPLSSVYEAASTRNSNFVYFLFELFDWQTIKEAIDPYFIGCTKDRATVFPQIDEKGKCRTAKIQGYNQVTGKRTKDSINWMHAILKKEEKLSDNFNLQMCLFGLHLIRSKKNKGKTICICESEKSAIIAAGVFSEYLWMSAGALHWLNVDKLLPLRCWNIILYPDTSKTGVAFEKWNKIAQKASQQGLDVVVSTLLEESCSQEQKEQGYDIGDFLIDILREQRKDQLQTNQLSKQELNLIEMKKKNPLLEMFIEKLELELMEL